MSKKRNRKFENIFEPVAVYVVTRNGLERPPGSTDADAWRDLRDIGRRLSRPPLPGETREQYAMCLRANLPPIDSREYVGGVAPYMLHHIVNLYCQPQSQA